MVYLNNLFGEIPERNVTFVIDSSGSMYDTLPSVKDHIVEILIERAYNRPDTTFNIIDFNSEVTEWADRMVECTPVTVNAAMRWLRGIETRPGSKLKTAVKMAFDEPHCDAIYLVTDGCVDQDADKVTHSIIKKSCNRPIHCITVMNQSDEVAESSRRFLEGLAMESRGSFHIIIINHLGDVTKVNDVYNATYVPVDSDEKLCSIDVSLNNNPYKHLFPKVHSTPYVPFLRYYPYVDTEALKEEILHTPVASVVARGTRVLARRSDDGYYYTAHIAQEVTGNRNKFLIEFDKTKKRHRDLRMQETFFHDIIAYNDALRHSVVADDKVLAPWEDDGRRYGPGKVIRGVEKRTKIGDHRDSELLVTFWNGATKSIAKGCAIWIPERLYDRIVLELQMPLSARKQFLESRDTTDLPPGYPSLQTNDDLFDEKFWDPLHSLRRQLLYYPWLNNGMYYLPTYPLLTPVPKLLRAWPSLIFTRPDLFYGTWPFYDETIIPYRRRYAPVSESPSTEVDLEPISGSNLTKRELRELVDQQLKEHEALTKEKEKLKEYLKRKELSSSSSSSSSSDDDDDSTLDKLLPRKDQGTLVKPSHLRRFRRQVEPRPEWKKYWPQTPQPRQHHLPAFQTRTPGLFSTWDDLDLNGGNCENKSALYDGDVVDLNKVKSDRARLIEHLKTPFVERPELAKYKPQLGSRDYALNRHKDRIMELQRRSQAARANAWLQKEEDSYQKSTNVQHSKRRETLMRIGSEMQRQRDFDQQISNTLEAKSKINQDFRAAFYKKELDNMNRQQARMNWLQTRRQMHTKSQNEKALQIERLQQSRELGRKYRQAKHHDLNIRRSVSADLL